MSITNRAIENTTEGRDSRLPLMNKNKYWFVRKTYGWGWVPGSWQGWAVLGIYTGAMATIFWDIDKESHLVSDTLINFILPAVGITLLLLIITLIKGEVPPKWQWGKISNDERKDD